MKIFVVLAEATDYDTEYTWAVCAFLHESAAEKWKEKAREFEISLKKRMTRKQYELCDEVNPHDEMAKEYRLLGVILYKIQEVEYFDRFY